MPREKAEAKSARTKQISACLGKAYPEAHCELRFTNPLDLLIATILSSQCTDARVNIVTETLFRHYRTAADYANAPLPELEQAVKSTGFYRNKAKNIQACCRALIERHGGEVPRTMAELTELAGVGRKTANVVLGNAFGLDEGVVVDTHVLRLSKRLGLTAETDPEKVETALTKLVPREQWTIFAHWLVWHGRRRCSARKPDCAGCELQELCPKVGVKAVAKRSE